MTSAPDSLRAALADRYLLEQELGAGGMATVYLAEDLKHHRKVALKVLRPDLAATLGAERFVREITIAAGLQHPHVVPLHDSGEAGGFLYYVMPYVAGTSLRERLSSEGELPIYEAARILRDVADALAYSHQHGVVHRDIKPENVMLSGRHAVVTDFGVAKAVSEATGRQQLTTMGVALGTPAYMSPEQATADPHVDHRADIYALGAMGFELLTGRPPFTGFTPQQVLAAHVTQTPESVLVHRASVPPAFAELIARCLQKKPADRPQSADELITVLESMLTPSGGTTPTDTRPYAAASAHGRGARVAAALVVCATIGVVGWFMIYGLRGGASRIDPMVNAAPSVGVLPFTELTTQQGQEYFADGLTEEVIGALSQLPGVRVPGRASTMYFKGSKASVKAIAESLHVGAILTASIQRSGDHVRIRAELLKASDGFQLWSETFDQQTTDLFAVYDRVAVGIAGALKVKLSTTGSARSASRTTASRAAYEAYLLGRYHVDQRDALHVDSARRYFEQAIAADSSWALAWSGLADALSLEGPGAYSLPGMNGDTALARALVAARHAVALDSTSVEARTSLAFALDCLWDWGEAGREYDRALALRADYAPLRHWHALHLAALGKFNEAVKESRRAVELDPLSWIYGDFLAMNLDASGQREAATMQFEKLIARHPNVSRLRRDAGVIAMRAGDFERAAGLYGKELDLMGDTAGSRRMRDGMQRRDSRAVLAVLSRGQLRVDIAMALGDRTAAVAALDELSPLQYRYAGNRRLYITNPEILRSERWRNQLRMMGLK